MKNYREYWTVKVNKSTYVLNEEQASLLKKEIANGNRGIVVFKEFAVSIPYIEEFYLSRKESTLKELPDEIIQESEKSQEWINSIRQKLGKKMSLN